MGHPTLEESRRTAGTYRWVEKEGRCSSCGISLPVDATNVYCDYPKDCCACYSEGTFKPVYTNGELGWLL